MEQVRAQISLGNEMRSPSTEAALSLDAKMGRRLNEERGQLQV